MRPILIAAALLLAAPAWAQAPAPRTAPPRGLPMAPTDQAAPSPRSTMAPPGPTGGTAPSAGTAGPAPVAGSPRPRRTLQDRFDNANTSHDGRLTLEQARAGHMNAVVRDFAQIDTGNRGYVTLDEIKAQRKAARQARKAAKLQQQRQ